MPSKLLVGVAQCHTQPTLPSTLALLRTQAQLAASKSISLLLFPEAFLGGYPSSCSFGAVIGSRTQQGRDQFLAYFKSCVDLGDTAPGEEGRWLRRELPVDEETGRRGDGTREYVEDVARQTGVFLVVGCVERAGGSLYCAVVFVDPVKGVVGKRRKVMPTGSERLVWAQGQPSNLRAVSANIKGVKVVMGAAICWENFMPLLRYALYSQGVNLWLAPTADGRPTWESLMKTIACEQRCFVVSGNQCIKTRDLPGWITGKAAGDTNGNANGSAAPLSSPPLTERRRSSVSHRTEENHEIVWRPKGETIGEAHVQNSVEEAVHDQEDPKEYASQGGSCIVNPFGETIAGPVWRKVQQLLYAEIDFDDCHRGRLDFDASGHYSRMDAFKLTVEGLDMMPPP